MEEPKEPGTGEPEGEFDEEEFAAKEMDEEPAADVQAENVTITQGGAQNVEAQTVTVNQGGIVRVDADTVSVRQGGVLYAKADTIQVTQGGIGLARADGVTVMAGYASGVLASNVSLDAGGAKYILAREGVSMQQAAALVVASPAVTVTNSITGFLLARQVNGNVRVLFDRQAALVFGIATGIVMGMIMAARRRE
jgi:hypothetical protein